jgi:host factor-I protein
MNRKLIRADLRDLKDHRPPVVQTTKYLQRRHSTPPDQTAAETNYYLKQMANHTRMVIVLKDGEKLHGTIEWYDRDALKVHRAGAPNILLMKDTVKYMYKEDDARRQEDEQGEG